jgi:hypothetical protein
LLAGRGIKASKEYVRRFEECDLKVKTLRNKNNELQKQCDSDMDRDIRKAIKLQASFLEVPQTAHRKKSLSSKDLFQG